VSVATSVPAATCTLQPRGGAGRRMHAVQRKGQGSHLQAPRALNPCQTEAEDCACCRAFERKGRVVGNNFVGNPSSPQDLASLLVCPRLGFERHICCLERCVLGRQLVELALNVADFGALNALWRQPRRLLCPERVLDGNGRRTQAIVPNLGRNLRRIRRKGTGRKTSKSVLLVWREKTLRATFCLPGAITGEDLSAHIVPC
jgi:hypothetical protein